MTTGTPKLKSFKLNAKKGKKRGIEVQFTRVDVDANGKPFNVDTPGQFHECIPHADLVALFRKLSPHYAMLTEREEHDESTLENAAEIERTSAKYPCGSIQWKEGENWSGVQFHGAAVLSTGHHCNALTRLVKFNSPTPDYPLADQLEELAQAIEAEALLCLSGKHGEPPPVAKADPAQTAITDPDQNGDGNGGEGGPDSNE